jgi:hypothetical protein
MSAESRRTENLENENRNRERTEPFIVYNRRFDRLGRTFLYV